MIISDRLEEQVINTLMFKSEELAKIVDAVSPDPEPEPETVTLLRNQIEALESIPGNNPAIEDAKSQLREQLASALILNSNQSKQSTLAREELIAMFRDRSKFWDTLSNVDKKNALGRLVRQILILDGQVTGIDLL